MEEDPIADLFNGIQKKFDSEAQRKDEIRLITKQIEQQLRSLTSLLAHVHSARSSIPTICQEARKQFLLIHELFGKIKQVVPLEKLFKYNDLWRYSLQQACFAAIFIVYLEEKRLITLPELEGFLGMKVDSETEFHLEIEDFLHGVCSLCSELARLAVNSVTSGNFEEPLKISKFISGLYSSFQLLNLKNDNLRKRFDAVKYDVKKVEEVVYDVSIRKLTTPKS